MKAPYVLRWRSSTCLRMTLKGAVCCVVLLGTPAFPQSGPISSQPPRLANSQASAEAPESPNRASQTQSALVDAPTASWNTRSQPPSNAIWLTPGQRFSIYRHSILSPYTAIGPALGAGIGQWEDEPPAWGEGAEGYGRRIASGMARHLISESIRAGVAAADGEDPRYHRSDERGFWPRTRHVIVETVTSQTASGARIPAFSRFAGDYGAAFISNTWYPANRATVGYALRRGSSSFGASFGFHLFEEFAHR